MIYQTYTDNSESHKSVKKVSKTSKIQCKTCGKFFCRPYTLKRHEKIHMKHENKHKKDECLYGANQFDNKNAEKGNTECKNYKNNNKLIRCLIDILSLMLELS